MNTHSSRRQIEPMTEVGITADQKERRHSDRASAFEHIVRRSFQHNENSPSRDKEAEIVNLLSLELTGPELEFYLPVSRTFDRAL